jgi:ubiquinone biosynthesis protein COQ9
VQVITAACYIGDMLPTADPIIDDQSSQDWADAAEQRVLDAALALAQTLAWSEALVLRAAQTAGLSAADAALLLPHGPADLAALLSRRHDRLALSRLAGIDASALKVRERIRVGAQARLDTALADEAAVRRATLYLARPDRAALAVSLAWETSDGLWRWAGDMATDENHYSKRAILAGVLTSTLAVRLAAGAQRAADYLTARIDNVMAFETWKAKLPAPSDALTRAAGWLGRLRYGARRVD